MKNLILTFIVAFLPFLAFTQIKIITSGNVGVGTENPQGKLHIEGGNLVMGLNGSTGAGISLKDASGGSSNEGIFYNFSPASFDGSIFQLNPIQDNKYAFFRIFPKGTSPTPRQSEIGVGHGNTDVIGEFFSIGTEMVDVTGNIKGSIKRNSIYQWFYSGGQKHPFVFGYRSSNSSFLETMRITSDGKLGLGVSNPSHPIHLSSGAHVTSAGVWTDASDLTLKMNVGLMSYGINEILKLNPVAYESRIDGSKQIGLIAQEVLKVVPEVVSSQGETLGIAYGHLVTLLIEGIKQQQFQIDELQKKVEDLEKKINP